MLRFIDSHSMSCTEDVLAAFCVAGEPDRNPENRIETQRTGQKPREPDRNPGNPPVSTARVNNTCGGLVPIKKKCFSDDDGVVTGPHAPRNRRRCQCRMQLCSSAIIWFQWGWCVILGPRVVCARMRVTACARA